MIKILSFELYGKFAHFKLPYSNSKFLKKSLFIPPISTIYGILGAIIGLNGFQQYNKNEPDYYLKLKHIPVAIYPLNLPQKFIVKYNSLNSFANNSNSSSDKDLNLIISEEVLFKPRYRIYLLLDEKKEYDVQLINNIISEKSVYHIYLGKNEFFANIDNIKIYDKFNRINTDALDMIDSIIPLQYIKQKDYENMIISEFINKLQFKDLKIKTSLINICFFISEEEEESIEFNKKIEIYSTENKKIFFFKNDE